MELISRPSGLLCCSYCHLVIEQVACDGNAVEMGEFGEWLTPGCCSTAPERWHLAWLRCTRLQGCSTSQGEGAVPSPGRHRPQVCPGFTIIQVVRAVLARA